MRFLLLVSHGAMVSEGGILFASILLIKADIRASLAGPLFFTIYIIKTPVNYIHLFHMSHYYCKPADELKLSQSILFTRSRFLAMNCIVCSLSLSAGEGVL